LENFYKKNGFESIGSTYLEDGIPHIAMLRNSSIS
jgi:predicted GNAT family N-acyltransferase